jgi:alpha/beta hydrolase fold
LSANIHDGALVTHDPIRRLAKRDILAKQYVYRWIDGILLDLKRRGLVLAPKAEIKCNK